MSRAAALPSLRFPALLAGAVAATLAGLAAGGGDPIVALAPLLGLGGLWALWRLPVRTTAFTLLFLVLSVDCIPERPQSGLWKSPLFPLGRLLFEQLDSLTGSDALHFPLLDVLVILLLGVVFRRRATGSTIDPPVAPLPPALKQTLLLSLGTIAWIDLWGAARGGDVRNSLWQLHQLGFIPLLSALYAAAVRGPEDHRTLARILVGAAFVKAAIGTYFILCVAHPAGWFPEFATAHSDSLTYVAAVMIAVTGWTERPDRRAFLGGLFILAVVGTGMYYNDRRLADVSLAGALAAAYLLSPWTPLKRFLTRGLLLLLPLGVLYVSAGWTSGSRLFGPVHTLRSLIEGEHAGEEQDYRDIENLDVIATWRKNPLLGTGFGHQFDEPYKLPDISFALPTYRFHPHNAVLGLLAFGGVLGLSGVWAYLVVAVFFAVRAYRLARPPGLRAAALVALSIFISYLNQCFGDMGTISWPGAFLVAVAVVSVGKLAVSVGASSPSMPPLPARPP